VQEQLLTYRCDYIRPGFSCDTGLPFFCMLEQPRMMRGACEVWAFNQWVTGSSPARLTTTSEEQLAMRPAAFLLWLLIAPT
jgi:hypothetical protein